MVGGSTPLDVEEVDRAQRRNEGAEEIWRSPTDRLPFQDLTRVSSPPAGSSTEVYRADARLW